MVPLPTLIYHITHLENLPSIIESGGLRAFSYIRRNGGHYTNIAHPNIQSRRANVRIYCGPGGTLHDYIPFYFAPRSPMLYALYKGAVEGYIEGQNPILHLVSSVETIKDRALPFVFSDGHPTVAISEFWDDADRLISIDWAVMTERYWNDTLEDMDRKRRRQAEFLVYCLMPWNAITEIGVINREINGRVREYLSQAEYVPPVSIRRDWYY